MKKYFQFKIGKGIIIQTMLILLLFILMTGCNERNNISDATLIGYDASSFEKTMVNYFEDMSNDEVVNLSYGWKEGWAGDDAPNPEVLISNEKAMTYVVSVDLASDGEKETNRMMYYMIHNTKENTLSVQGGSFDEDGDIYPMSLSEARNEMEMIFSEYN